MVSTDVSGNLAASTVTIQQVETTVTTVNMHSTQIAALQSNVTTHTAEIAALEAAGGASAAQVAALGGRIDTNSGEIAVLDTRVASNTGQIAALDVRVDANTADISSLDSRVTSTESGFSDMSGRIDKAFEGTAMALAMVGGGLPSDKDFAMSLNWGTFEGENAFAGTAQARISENFLIHGGLGIGANQGTVGGRAGLTYAW